MYCLFDIDCARLCLHLVKQTFFSFSSFSTTSSSSTPLWGSMEANPVFSVARFRCANRRRIKHRATDVLSLRMRFVLGSVAAIHNCNCCVKLQMGPEFTSPRRGAPRGIVDKYTKVGALPGIIIYRRCDSTVRQIDGVREGQVVTLKIAHRDTPWSSQAHVREIEIKTARYNDGTRCRPPGADTAAG